MKFTTLVQQRTLMLAEGPLDEALRQYPSIEADPHLGYAPVIYTPAHTALLEALHDESWQVAHSCYRPMITLTNTRWANLERLKRSIYLDRDVNQDHVHFLKTLRAKSDTSASPIFIGGRMGPRADTHQLQEGLSRTAAERFHTYQIEALAHARPDFLVATHLSAFSEAHGIAYVMASVQLPYILSFAIHPMGTLLDGSPLRSAIDLIDATVQPAPLGYGVSGIAPSVMLKLLEGERLSLTRRLVQFHAHLSSPPPKDLSHPATAPHPFAVQMAAVRTRFGIPILGGGDGTKPWDLELMAWLT